MSGQQATTTTPTEAPKPKFGEAALAASKAAKEQATQPKPVETIPTPVVVAKEPTAQDILRRTSTTQPQGEVAPSDSHPAPDDFATLDPVSRKALEDKIRNLESGYNKKYQALAEERKKLEAKSLEAETWTPQKLQQYLSRPDFVAAAQALQQQAAPQQWTGSSEEWSALTENEKGQFLEMNQRLSRQELQMNHILKTREDELLKQQYPDYEPQTVDKLMQDLLSGSYQATRADVWKVANFETAVERAYRLGKEDAQRERTERGNAASIAPSNGMSVRPADDIPEDVRKGGISAIGRWRLNQFKLGKGK